MRDTISVRIGLLHDAADSADAPEFEPGEWIDRALADLRSRPDAPELMVEQVHAYALGLPSGTIDAVERVMRELAAQDVHLIIGPSLADNAIAATALADELGVPTINWADTARARGRWMFQLPTGSHEDEPREMIRHFVGCGAQRIVAVHDRSPSGMRMLGHLREAATAAGMAVTDVPTGSGEDTQHLAASALAGSPDGIALLGVDRQLSPIVTALARGGWTGPSVVNAGAWHAASGDLPLDRHNVWYFTTTSPDNPELARARTRIDDTSTDAVVALGHDLGRLVAEAVSATIEDSRMAVRHALQHNLSIPAAMGAPGTMLGFSVKQRGALHGAAFPVLRRDCTELGAAA